MKSTPLTSTLRRGAVALAAAGAVGSAHAGFLDSMRDMLGIGSPKGGAAATRGVATPPLAPSTGSGSGLTTGLVQPDPQAAALCDDVERLVQEQKQSALREYMPKESVSTVINDRYKVDDLLRTEINFNSILSGNIGSLFESAMRGIADKFVGQVRSASQSYMQGAVNDAMNKVGAAGVQLTGPSSSSGGTSLIDPKSSKLPAPPAPTPVTPTPAPVFTLPWQTQPVPVPPAGTTTNGCVDARGVNLCNTLR